MSENYTQLIQNESLLFEQLFESAQIGLVYVDGSRNIVKVNQKMIDIFGYNSTQELIGKNISSIHVNEEKYLEFGEKFFYSLSNGVNIDIEYPLRKKDGSSIICLVSGKALDTDTPVDLSQGVLWSVYDISQKKSYELELLKAKEKLQHYLDIAGSIIITLDTNGLVTLINSTGSKLLQASEGEIIGKNWFELFLVDDEKKEVKESFSKLMQGSMENTEFTKNYIQTFDKKKKLIAWQNRLIRDDKGKIEGILSSGQDITQSHQLSLDLEAERRRFMLAIEGSQDGLWDWNKKNDEAYLSDRFFTMLGYEAGELSQSSEVFSSLVHPDDITQARKVIYKYLNNQGEGTYSSSFRMLCKDGTYKWVSSRGKAHFNVAGKFERFIGFITDISEQKLLQKELEDQANELQNVINGTPDLLFYKDYKNSDGKYIGCNNAFANFVGKEKSEILSHTDRELFGEKVANFFRAKDKKILSQNKSDINEEWVKYPDGKEVLLATSKTPFYDTDKNRIGIVGVSRDITKSKSIEEKFKRLGLLLSNTMNSVDNLVFVKDINLKYLVCNEAFEKFIGHTKEELIGKDDYDFFEKEIADIYRVEDKKNLEDGKKTESLKWVTNSNGEEIYLYTIVAPLRDSANNIIGIVGNGVDLTHQKRLEDQLSEQRQYLQSIIDGVADPIMVIKDDYSIETMNEVVKKNIKNLKILDSQNPKCYEVLHQRTTPCDGISHPCPLKDVMQSGKNMKVVHKQHNTQGSVNFLELSATPLLDKEGKCIGIIELARDITEYLVTQDKLTQQKNILDHQAHHDALTGLPNRVLFEDRLQQSIETSKRKKSKVALLFIDLDHFKEINDSLGHLIGDEVLKVVALRLRNTIRKEDTLARLGGDEFTIILGDLEDEQSASLVAKNILETLVEPIVINENNLYISSSIGISIYPTDGISTENLLKYADSAMYKAKDEGRNNYQYYNSKLTQLAFERVFMEASLREAIQKREFIVYYQPQVNALNDKLIGMEALVRWQHPTLGLLAPSKFIVLAERTGLVIQIDRLIMKIAMSQVAHWYHNGFNPGRLAINISMKNLEQQDFFTMFKTQLKETGCKAEWIELEVTEGQVMTHPEEAIQILQKISNLGVELAIDDFGTGYSSLAYLKKLPINKLKIDQAFIKELPFDEEDAGITKAVIALAKSLNLKIIAEGVETKAQKIFLTTHGCTTIQGYYYSKPILADKLEPILKNGNIILK